MPVFEYEGLSNSGKALRGIIDAESMRTARSKLRSQGVYPTEIREEAVAVALPGTSFRLFSGVPPKELARVFRQLATLVGAGMLVLLLWLNFLSVTGIFGSSCTYNLTNRSAQCIQPNPTYNPAPR